MTLFCSDFNLCKLYPYSIQAILTLHGTDMNFSYHSEVQLYQSLNKKAQVSAMIAYSLHEVQTSHLTLQSTDHYVNNIQAS